MFSLLEICTLLGNGIGYRRASHNLHGPGVSRVPTERRRVMYTPERVHIFVRPRARVIHELGKH